MKRFSRTLLIAPIAALVVLMALYALSTQTDLAKARPAQAGPAQADPTPTPPATPLARPWLGLALAHLNDRTAARLGIPKRDGVVVLRAQPDGPAAAAGVQAKDVITAINGTAVKTLLEVRKQLEQVKPGDTVQLSIYRGDQALTIAVKAATASARPGRGPGPRHHLRGLPGAPRMPELQGIPRDQLFDHLLGGQLTVTDKDGKEVTVHITPSKVVSVSATSLTILPNGKSQQVTYQITANTKSRGNIAELKAEDKVVVISRNTSLEANAVIIVRRGQTGSTTQGLRGPMPRFRGEGAPFSPGQTSGMLRPNIS